MNFMGIVKMMWQSLLWRRRDEAVDKSKKFCDNVGPAHGSGLVFGGHRGAGGRNRGAGGRNRG